MHFRETRDIGALMDFVVVKVENTVVRVIDTDEMLAYTLPTTTTMVPTSVDAVVPTTAMTGVGKSIERVLGST